MQGNNAGTQGKGVFLVYFLTFICQIGTAIKSIRFNPQQPSLAAVATNTLIHLVDVSRGVVVHTVNGQHQKTVNACDWSRDGKLLVSCSADDAIVVLDLSGSSPTVKASLAVNEKMFSCVFSPVSSSVVYFGSYQSIHAWNFATSSRHVQAAHDNLIPCLATTVMPAAGGARAAQLASVSHDASVKLWALH